MTNEEIEKLPEKAQQFISDNHLEAYSNKEIGYIYEHYDELVYNGLLQLS